MPQLISKSRLNRMLHAIEPSLCMGGAFALLPRRSQPVAGCDNLRIRRCCRLSILWKNTVRRVAATHPEQAALLLRLACVSGRERGGREPVEFTRSFLSLGFVGATYQFRNTNKRVTTTVKSATTPRTRDALLPKIHSVLSASFLTRALVTSTALLTLARPSPPSRHAGGLGASSSSTRRCMARSSTWLR